MSVSIRISDDTYDEIMELKAKKVSINKTVDMILKLALNGIEKYRINFENSDDDENDDDDFPERIKKISECIFEELKECDETLEESESKNNYSKDDELENEKLKNELQELKNQILNSEKSEKHFEKIENELSEISKQIIVNRKCINEKSISRDEDIFSPSTNFKTLVTVEKEDIHLAVYDRKEFPILLPENKSPWMYMQWIVSDRFNSATLVHNFNPLATADLDHNKIMIVTPLGLQVWYEMQGDMQVLMYACERRLMKTFNKENEYPLWFTKGIQFTYKYDYHYNQKLYDKQDEINEERRKRGLYEFECFRF